MTNENRVMNCIPDSPENIARLTVSSKRAM